MNIQEICDLIDENFYKENNYYLSINNPEEFAKQVALEFGKQCFEAGITCFEENNELEYSNFEDYLETVQIIHQLPKGE